MAKDIGLEDYRPDQATEWDAFVTASNNGTLFHTQAFLGYHGEKLASGFRHLRFLRGGKLAAVLPLGEAAPGEWRTPFGASFGGFATADRAFAHHRDLVEALLGHARARGVARLRYTPPPALYHRQADQALEFALLKAGFRLETRELCQVVDLAALPAGDPSPAYAYACDKQVRKAKRAGLSAGPLEDLAGFHALLVANRARHGVAPTHSLADLGTLKARVPEAFHLFGVFQDGALLAATLAFAVTPAGLLNFYTCHREDAATGGAAHLVNHHVILWARERGFRYYDFGTSTAGMEPNEGLIRFKEGFGGGAVLRDTFVWEAPSAA